MKQGLFPLPLHFPLAEEEILRKISVLYFVFVFVFRAKLFYFCQTLLNSATNGSGGPDFLGRIAYA